MKRLRNKYKNKKATNKGASTTIEFIFAILFLVMFSISILDMGCYFMNRQIVSNAAQNGARLVSVYGGTGGKEGTSIAKTYGESVDGDCVYDDNPVTCSVEKELKGSQGISLNITNIECGPYDIGKIGERTWCEVTWDYPGIPGSAMTFFKRSSEGNTTRMTSEAEVITNANKNA